MKKSKTEESCCNDTSCCKVESMITVDERGQMVLPKEIRERAGITPGEKLILVTWENEQGVCCISLSNLTRSWGWSKRVSRRWPRRC